MALNAIGPILLRLKKETCSCIAILEVRRIIDMTNGGSN